MHALMVLATFCWAANIVAAKFALRGFTPLALVQLRVGGAALIFLILFAVLRSRAAVRPARRQWGPLVVLALTGVTFNQFFFLGGVARTSVAHTGLITALGPVIVLVLACLIRLETLTITKFVGMLVSFSGVAVLSLRGSGQENGAHWLGDLFILGASTVFACYTIQVKKVVGQYDALTLNTLIFGLGALMMLPYGARPVLATHWSAVSSQEAWALGYMVVFGSVVPYTIYVFAMTDLAASRVAAFSYLQPGIATTLGIWLLAEELTWRLVAGGALILLGVYLTERERGEEKPLQDVTSGSA
jgi:drug/metabolite transporter (DMT)-like permease